MRQALPGPQIDIHILRINVASILYLFLPRGPPGKYCTNKVGLRSLYRSSKQLILPTKMPLLKILLGQKAMPSIILNMLLSIRFRDLDWKRGRKLSLHLATH